MSKYCLAIVAKPPNWKPDHPDDVPAELTPTPAIQGEFDDLFPALRAAVEWNEKSLAAKGSDWAVVVDTSSPGRRWGWAAFAHPSPTR